MSAPLVKNLVARYVARIASFCKNYSSRYDHAYRRINYQVWVCSSTGMLSCCCRTENGDGRSSHHHRSLGLGAVILCRALLGFKKKQEEEVNELTILLKRAKLALMQHDLNEAEKLFHQALQLAQQQKPKKSKKEYIESITYIYDNMANLAFSTGQFDKAEKLFKETMKGLLQNGRPQDDNSLVEISLKLAMIYALQEKMEQAAAGYKYCIDTQEKKIAEADHVDDDTMALLGLTVDSYSRFLIVQDRLEEAQESLEQALKIATEVFGEEHEQVIILLNDIATVACLRKDYKLAEEYLMKVVNVGAKIDSKDLPTFYCNLGAVYMHQGKYEDSRDTCRHALEMARKAKDKLAETQARKCLSKLDIIKKEIEEKEMS